MQPDNLVSFFFCFRQDIANAYIGVGLDLLKCFRVKLACIGTPSMNVISLFNTSSATLGQRTSVDVVYPSEMRVGINRSTLFKSDDELVRYGFWLLMKSCGSSEDSREQSSEIESETADASHGCDVLNMVEERREEVDGCSNLPDILANTANLNSFHRHCG